MLTTSSILARQRGHGGALPPRLLLISSDTTMHAPCVRADRLWRPLYQTLDGSVGCRPDLVCCACDQCRHVRRRDWWRVVDYFWVFTAARAILLTTAKLELTRADDHIPSRARAVSATPTARALPPEHVAQGGQNWDSAGFFTIGFRERNSVGGFIQSGMGRDKERIAIMPTSREHRHRAGDCLRLANETNELFAKMALLEMAAEFRARAQQLELRERRSRQRFSPAAIKKFAARY
jgi:hypothetical protein